MALELLEVQPTAIIHCIHHDLESSYWVLLWVILRHTVHNLGQEYCAKLFRSGDDDAGFARKLMWVSPFRFQTRVKFQVEGNAPLTTLIEDFRILLRKSFYDHVADVPGVDLTYDSVLDIFRKAVADQTAWPANDFVHCALLKKTLDTAIVGAQDDTQGTITRGLEDDGVDLDAHLDVDSDVDDDDSSAEVPAGNDMEEKDEQAEGKDSREDDQQVEEAYLPRDDQPVSETHSARKVAEPVHAPIIASCMLPVVGDAVTASAVIEGDPRPQPFGMMTRLPAKGDAAVAVDPAPEPEPSRPLKRRRLNP